MEITKIISIPDDELTVDFTHASGPGGQNVNKVASAVQLRFDVLNSPSLPFEIKERLIKHAGNRITRNGILIIEAKRFRTREQNRHAAEERLKGLIQKALVIPKKRRLTQPNISAKVKRMETKKRRGDIKSLRQSPPSQDD